MNVLHILQQLDIEEIQKLVAALSKNNIVSDEEGTCLSSSMVEKWTDSCEKFLRSNGYSGGAIKKCAKFFNNHGAVYVIYDSAIISKSEAIEHLNLVSKQGSL